MSCKRALRVALPMLACAALAYAGILGNVRGVVHDPDHRPIQGAEVVLHSDTSDWSKTSKTTPEGEVEFSAVPVGEYRVTAKSEGFTPMELRVLVTSGSAPVLHFQLTIAVTKQVTEVSERAELVKAWGSGKREVLAESGVPDRRGPAGRWRPCSLGRGRAISLRRLP